MQGIDQDLLRDIECYTCGEEASPFVLLRAPRLEDWAAVVRRQGKMFSLAVTGQVHRHPDPTFADGDRVSTSAVVWFDRHRRWIRTYSRHYVLGKPSA